MTKTITITDAMMVEAGDKAYFKGCDFGFTVLSVKSSDKNHTLMVSNPLSGFYYWARSQQFDHATREVEEPEWPDPQDFKLHVYLGADGLRYIYNPVDATDPEPWTSEHHFEYRTRRRMEADYHDALPLTELELVHKERES